MTRQWLGRRVGAVATAALLTSAATGLLLPFAGSAQAAVTDVTAVSNPSADTSQATGTTAYFQVTVNSTVASGEVEAIVQTGPDAGVTAYGGNGPLAKDISCVVSGGPFNGLTPSSSAPVCAVANSLGAGQDTVLIFADKNGDNAYSSGSEPSATVHATFVGAVATVSLTPTTGSTSQGTCTPFTVFASDALGGMPANQAIEVTALQGTTPAAGPTALQFCNDAGTPAGTTAPADSDASLEGLHTIVTTGAAGQPVVFGIKSDSVNPITVRAFVDQDADHTFDAGEPQGLSNLTITPGGTENAKQITLTPSTTTPFTGDVVTIDAVVKNVAGDPLAGVTPVMQITGANPQGTTVAPSATNAAGKTTFSYNAANAGADTVLVFVNQACGGTGNADACEPQQSVNIAVGGAVSNAAIDLTATGSAAGGSTKSTDSTIAENSIVPTTQSTETFTAVVTDASSHAVKSGVPVRFQILANVDGSGASADDGVLTGASSGVLTATTDADGKATATLSNPSPVTGDAFSVQATVAGTAVTDTGYVLWQASSAGINQAPTGTNGALGSSFPGTSGSIVIDPAVTTTQVNTTKNFTATVKDQYATPKSGVQVFFVVLGRNSLAPPAAVAADRPTNGSGQVSFAYADTGSSITGSNTSVPGTYDQITGVVDTNADNIYNAATEPTGTATRYYTVDAPTVAAIEGGFGSTTNEFGAPPGFSPNTSDDTTTMAVDVTHARAAMTAVQGFFQVRDSSGFALPGTEVSITSTGVGDLVDASNTALSGAQTVVVDANGFAKFAALSTATGTQTITGTSNGQTKSLTITWTSSGTGRTLTLTPATQSVTNGQPASFTAHVKDLYGNAVQGQSIQLGITGPGQFGNGTNSITGTSDANGDFVAAVNTVGIGTITITATATGAQFGAAANTPNQGDPAGVGTATSTLTSAAEAAPSATNTTLQTTVGQADVNTFVTAVGVIKDQNGAVLSGVPARFFVSGPVTGQSALLTSDSLGRVAYTFSSASTGTVTVKLSVVNSGGVEQFNKTTTVQITSSVGPRPKLSQTSSGGVVFLTLQAGAQNKGKTVYFFRRSGLLNIVVPAGTCVLNSSGACTRVLHQRSGQVLALYSKVLGAVDVPTPYSNDIAFHVR